MHAGQHATPNGLVASAAAGNPQSFEPTIPACTPTLQTAFYGVKYSSIIADKRFRFTTTR
jgi:hypothetical protein